MESPLIKQNSILNIKNLIIFLLASVVQFYIGKEFYISALGGLKNRIADMNLLVVLGTTAAYLYSVLVLFFPNLFPQNVKHLYFDGAAAIITFVLMGRYLEYRAKNKAGAFIKKLFSLKPQKATVLKDGKEIELPVEEIKKGDIVVVKPGEKIPVDGVVIKGEAEIDQSVITGESIPVLKKSGDTVISGTINKNGYLLIKTIKTGKETFIYQVIKLVLEAQEKKPPVGRLADRIVSIFVPAIIIISIITFDIWYLLDNFQLAFITSVSVLIIACPCALGIATPIAIVVAVGRGAKEGILIKNIELIEKIKDISIAAFDKTGTITYGKLDVVDKEIFDTDLLRFAYMPLKKSNHPVATAVLKEINPVIQDVESFSQIPGKGIKAVVDGKQVLIGNPNFLKENNINLNIEPDKTCVAIAVNGKLAGIFYIEDRLKEEVPEVIKKLKQMGVKTVLLTGDNKKVAEKIGKQAGFDEVYYQLLPDEKYEIIKRMKDEGKKVLFVGDGINDAPAMVESDIGIAVIQATDIAKEAGDILLLKNDLFLVLKAIDLSEKTLKIIKQNLLWAYLYNIIGIPIAAGILYPLWGILLQPVFAGLAMSFSSVSVVTNALRLQILKIGDKNANT